MRAPPRAGRKGGWGPPKVRPGMRITRTSFRERRGGAGPRGALAQGGRYRLGLAHPDRTMSGPVPVEILVLPMERMSLVQDGDLKELLDIHFHPGDPRSISRTAHEDVCPSRVQSGPRRIKRPPKIPACGGAVRLPALRMTKDRFRLHWAPAAIQKTESLANAKISRGHHVGATEIENH